MTSCPHCGQPLSRDNRCSFCVPPKLYSPAQAVRRYFVLLGRSSAPGLDPSQEDTRGGAVGPVSLCLHERARLGRIMAKALGDEGKEGADTWKALVAFYGPSGGAKVDLMAEIEGASVRWWGELAGEALHKIGRALDELGLLKPREDWFFEEGEEAMTRIIEPPEPIFGTWEEIADYLQKSTRTVRDWYHGTNGVQDPCGIRDAVRIVGRRVHAKESAIRKCFDRLYGGGSE